MTEVFICDAVRTPIGRYGGALSSIRTDDLATLPIKALMERNPSVDWGALDDVIYGCVNQSGEDNRNVARMALLLAGLPQTVPGATVNRLCGSSLDAVGTAARAIRCGETQLMIAGGVESMSRAPFVIPKSDSAFSRAAKIEDTTIGWRFVNPLMKQQYSIDSMPETGEAYAAYLERSQRERNAFYLAHRREDDAIVGFLNISEIVRGALQGAFVGYWAGVPFAGRGYMARGLALVLRHAFRKLKLHRLEANLQPGNARSRKLAKGAGFRKEGFSPRYLKIGGRWRDHERWVITKEEWGVRGRAARGRAPTRRPRTPRARSRARR